MLLPKNLQNYFRTLITTVLLGEQARWAIFRILLLNDTVEYDLISEEIYSPRAITALRVLAANLFHSWMELVMCSNIKTCSLSIFFCVGFIIFNIFYTTKLRSRSILFTEEYSLNSISSCSQSELFQCIFSQFM